MPVRQTSSLPTALEQWSALRDLEWAVCADAALRVEAHGGWGAARALVVAALSRASGRPVLALAPEMADAHRLAQDLAFFEASFGGAALARVLELAPPQPASWRGGRHGEAEAERALICHRLLTGAPTRVVTTPAGLDAELLPPATFRERTLRLVAGDALDRDRLFEGLAEAGYERVDSVSDVGQWSARGGIVDVFSPAEALPFRLELLGDDVESIRLFDPTSQRSVEARAAVDVLPLGSAEGGAETATVLAYLPGDALVVLTDPEKLDAPREEAPAAVPLPELVAGFQRLDLTLLPGSGEADARIDLATRSVGGFRGQFKLLAEEVERWRAEGFTVRLVAGDPAQADRLRRILSEHGLEAWPDATLWSDEGLGVVVGDCSAGVLLGPLGRVLLTEEEIFGARRRRLKQPVYQRGAAIASYHDLTAGDLVVHEAHGVGRFQGLRTLSANGREAEFLLLEYAEGGSLYLPVARLDLISKYLGGATDAARLDRMGGAAWGRVKESVRKAVREMAEQLLKLYARRAVAEREPFAADTPWQREFEAAFRFEETPDQLRAIEQAKADMERATPMDRLVAGDVGYGKTEVALRAAFKAVSDGRQVAVLVPTTVLAQQHYNTFADRFGPFPAKVELLSRFRSPKEQKAVVAGLAAGTVDVVVGTHRLLSKDVAFKRLGMLVIDEEHRFGVTHKERIKDLKAAVDVLTLTATPIPRTLHMALAGVRDLSLIETPPMHRLPVETVVSRFSTKTIAEAVERELQRGGQVFFVHNRVQSLVSMAHLVQSLCPEARVLMAHGQMPERELESVMVKFVDGQADVLVCTAIVESGLDIPASNTIVINRADRFGLAQLYQLRGRVGRERQQAYAYLMVPADGRVDETAQRRLRVIEELTELGAGFKLAMRDMEIRGAGNLLGAEQHGHIAAVGFDLYTKLLEEAVREIRGQPAEPRIDPTIAVEAEALLPESYVPEDNQRLVLYRRLADVETEAEIAELRAELGDRFGPPPAPVETLLDVVGLRLLARAAGVEKLEAQGARAVLTFAPSTPLTPERIVKIIADSRGTMAMRKEFALEAKIPAGPWPAVREAIARVLRGLLAGSR